MFRQHGVWIQKIKREGITNMNKKGTALLLVSEGLNSHPSHIVDNLVHLVKKEYDSVVILPYPDSFKTIATTERVALEVVRSLLTDSLISTIFYVENNDFTQSILKNDKVQRFLEDMNMEIEDYSDIIQPVIDRMHQTSSRDRDALLIYKKRTDDSMEELVFKAAIQLCKNKGATGVAVIIFNEIPYYYKQEWIDQINILESGFICSNEETDFPHEVVESSDIQQIDIAIVTAIDRNQQQNLSTEIDTQKMN